MRKVQVAKRAFVHEQKDRMKQLGEHVDQLFEDKPTANDSSSGDDNRWRREIITGRARPREKAKPDSATSTDRQVAESNINGSPFKTSPADNSQLISP